MTDREAILILQELWRYEQVKYKDCEVRTALEMAIKVLKQKSKYRAKARHFKRKYLLLKQKYETLKQKSNTNYRAFAEWVADETFSENWELNKDAFAELACRRLEKLEIVKADGDKWKLKEG